MRFQLLASVLGGCIAMGSATASASPNAYGGYDIAGPYEANESPYGSTRGWEVFKAHDVDRNAYCVAVGGGAVRIGYDGLQWQVAVPVQSRPDWSGTFEVDGKVFNYASGTAVDGWTIVWIGMPEVDSLKAGSHAVVGIGKADYDFALAGSAAAIGKVEECVRNGGVAPAGKPAAKSVGKGPAARPAAMVAGRKQCKDDYAEFSCTLSAQPNEPGYREVMRIDADAGNISYVIKIWDDTAADVLVAIPHLWQGWKEFGLWVPDFPGSSCIRPGNSQSPQVIDNYRGESWSLCVN